MDDYKGMYLCLCSAIGDALDAMDVCNYGLAMTYLKDGMINAEEQYINQGEP